MDKGTKIIIALIIMMALSLWLNPVTARSEEIKKGFHFGLSDEMKVGDSQKYLTPFQRGGETLLGTGLCYGSFFSVSYGGRWLADALSVCALGAVSQTGEKTATMGIDLINFLGIQAGVQYDAENRKPFYSFGISLTSLGKQLLK